MPASFKETLILLFAAAAAGCRSVGPDFAEPHEQWPARYSSPRPMDVASPPPTAPVEKFWWAEFRDPELSRLETLAGDGNLDLKVAYLRIVESRIQVQMVRAQGWPNLNASATVTREQLGIAGILKSAGPGLDLGSPGAQALVSSIEKPVTLWQLGFDATWELDLFGRVRRTVEAAKAAGLEAVETRNDLLVTLQAEVAQTYFKLRAGYALQALTRKRIAAQRELVDLTHNRQEHGLSGEADVDTAQAQLDALESQLPSFEQMVVGARHSLAVLVGQPPEGFAPQGGDSGAMPPLPARIDVGIPSRLARRRADIRSAEAGLHAATAEIGVAVASLFPTISLTGTYGIRNTSARSLFEWASRFYTAGPAISLPIFNGGILVAHVHLARAQAAEAAITYRKTVLSALQEVEDSLSDWDADTARIAALQRTVASDQRALDLDMDAYRRGLTSYITVLTVQLQVTQAEQQLVQAVLTQGTDIVKLYKALGGGWGE